MGLFDSISKVASSAAKIAGTATVAVAKTVGRAAITVPTVAANIIAPKSQVAKTLYNVYSPSTAIKDAGTTLSVASLAAGGLAVKAGTSILAPKIVASAAGAAAGSFATVAPKKTEKIVSKAPSTAAKIINKAAENPTAAIAAAAALPIVAFTAIKAAPAVTSKASNLISSKDNVVEKTKEIPVATNLNNPPAAGVEPLSPVATKEGEILTSSQTPQTPETVQLKEGNVITSKRRKKRTIKPLMQNFKQSVNVIVQNKANSAYSKKYINKVMYA